MTKIRVIAAVVDTRQLTLYKHNGDTVRIPQGDPRVQRILDEHQDDLTAQRTVEVDLSIGDTATTDYQEFENSTNGIVRFFKVAKSAITDILGRSTNTEGSSGKSAPAVKPVALGDVAGIRSIVDDVMANAEPATNDTINSDQTVVAMVNNVPVPGAENLHRQFAYANKMSSRNGMVRFLERISKVIERRQHSIQDLLTFMEKGDLPIADDGSIVIYKILKRHENSEGFYVDCYTLNVRQRVSSYVCMDPSMVDPNRLQECSNGLHVARRGYLSSFGGDVCVLAKVAPEDVIAVPQEDPNKMRVCGYHILFELTNEVFNTLRQNRAMTNSVEGRQLLARAISGDHEPAHEEVRIKGQRGSDVVITPFWNSESKSKFPQKAPKKPIQDEAEAIDIRDPKKVEAPPVDPRKVNEKARTAQPKQAQTKTRKERIESMLTTVKDRSLPLNDRVSAADDLIALRATAKKSWKALGYPELTDKDLPYMAQTRPEPGTKGKKTRAKTKGLTKAKMGNSRTNVAAMFFNQGKWDKLLALKKKSKVGWARLGFDESQIKTIKKNVS